MADMFDVALHVPSLPQIPTIDIWPQLIKYDKNNYFDVDYNYDQIYEWNKVSGTN